MSNATENVHPMYQQLNASPAEKVEILASNPYRYYVAPNLWIGPNASRLKELDDLHKAALAQEEVALCARIAEVREALMTLYA